MSEFNNESLLYLEEVNGKEAVEYVSSRSEGTLNYFQDTFTYKEVYQTAYEIETCKDKVLFPSVKDDFVYEVYKDEKNPLGLLRRQSLSAYLEQSSDFETILDLDELSQKEDKQWVYQGLTLAPCKTKAIFYLSDGGKDASYLREFDLAEKDFVKENAFFTETEVKGTVTWLDANTLFESLALSEDDSTASGYSKKVRFWKRGEKPRSGEVLREVPTDYMRISTFAEENNKSTTVVGHEMVNFYSHNWFVWQSGSFVQINVPQSFVFCGFVNDYVIFQSNQKETWCGQNLKDNSIYAIKQSEMVSTAPNFTEVFSSTEELMLANYPGVTKDHIYFTCLNHVNSKLFKSSVLENFKVSEVETGYSNSAIHIVGSSYSEDILFYMCSNFLESTSLNYLKNNKSVKLKSNRQRVPSDEIEVVQEFAISNDGARVPYYIVRKKGLQPSADVPVAIYAYGGFRLPMTPNYQEIYNKHWVLDGGIYVLANIRGGGEYGIDWHEQALREKRQNAYNDLFKVTEKLIDDGWTNPKKLSVIGGSNGGLLVGVAMTQRPELYNAIVCMVPLLDMQRYHKLLAGASWMAEYGDPDKPEEWEFIKTFSPFHLLDAKTEYPKAFIYTSTKDDRVHPGHARKFSAKLSALGIDNFYYENTQGGHAGSATPDQRATMQAMTFAYLKERLFEGQ